jgi:hypothetical protein
MTKSTGVGRGAVKENDGRLRHGHTTGRTMSPTYNSWRGMIERCKPTKQYGKSGIGVCERWSSFDAFLTDMGERPAGCEIDRKRHTGNYNPGNCQWTPLRENKQQRRTTLLTPQKRARITKLKSMGVSPAEIAKQVGVSRSCVYGFLRGDAWG